MKKRYTIKRQTISGARVMRITSKDDPDFQATYRIDGDDKAEKAQVRRMHKAIKDHMDNGGTLGNYQW